MRERDEQRPETEVVPAARGWRRRESKDRPNADRGGSVGDLRRSESGAAPIGSAKIADGPPRIRAVITRGTALADLGPQACVPERLEHALLVEAPIVAADGTTMPPVLRSYEVSPEEPAVAADAGDGSVVPARQIIEGGKLLGLRVLDHVIVGEDGSFSFLDAACSGEHGDVEEDFSGTVERLLR